MKLAIIGAGELANEIYELIKASKEIERWEDVFFVGLHNHKPKNIISEEEFFSSGIHDTKILIAMGEPVIREKMYQKYKEKGASLTSFIHPLAYVSGNVKLEEGVILFPFVYIAPNVTIKENVLIHAHAAIENDCSINRNCFISSRAFIGAKSKIEETCFIGPGAVIRDSIRIESHSIIGMGSVVVKNITGKTVVAGNPAKKIKENVAGTVFQ